MAALGYSVTVFEAFHTVGGVLVYGIPEFRLPKAIVAKEAQALADMGVEFVTNCVIGRTLTIDELFEMGYEACYRHRRRPARLFGRKGRNLNGVLTGKRVFNPHKPHEGLPR